ncbi:glutathione S-transferase C-terminal domain-containing protein [Streptomyces sp. NBC_01537]|uniref:glutathione S-transferase C-terminal domain-containing protein n=1 Tax=Streptomyces sp. NBC_01537 TaxID=2903896 RepID=UPI00386B6EA7
MSETFTSLRFRDRIGAGPSLGFYPAPHRYHLYLSPGCPLSLRVSITLGLLGLEDSVGTTVLSDPAGACDALAAAALRTAYETTRHHYDGPLTVPALCDRWSGRVVSNHTPDILDDLALHFAAPDDTAAPRLRPDGLASDIDAIRELLDGGLLQDTALDLLDAQLASGPYMLGGTLTAADVDVWVALAHADADADTQRRIAGRDRLRSYLRRLSAHPAFQRIPGPEGEREHTAHDLCSVDKDCVGDQSRVTVLAGHECQRQALAC